MSPRARLPEYSHILLMVDASMPVAEAVIHAIRLAWATGARLTALSVVDTHAAFSTGLHYHDALKDLRRGAEEALSLAKNLAEKHGLRIKTMLVEGRPGEAICQAARAIEADVLVLGAWRHSLLGGLLPGRASDYILRHAPCSVFIARAPLQRKKSLEKPIREGILGG